MSRIADLYFSKPPVITGSRGFHISDLDSWGDIKHYDGSSMVNRSFSNIVLEQLLNLRDECLKNPTSSAPYKLLKVTCLSAITIVGYTLLNFAELSLRILICSITFISIPIFLCLSYTIDFCCLDNLLSYVESGVTTFLASISGIPDALLQMGAGFVAGYEMLTRTDPSGSRKVCCITNAASFGLQNSLWDFVSTDDFFSRVFDKHEL